ncbi:ABC transporter ATP-binding protein/permease [Breznakiella homolactica]|uniref:ABC transporter ATP-binding protein n=2 Tax=Breznakiella homolactica TaxID=2798577 RepID=A0A7T8BCC3_9SPIR|nr:ABC transporter ATP-binding protein/permease [Breznakiella homolactica]
MKTGGGPVSTSFERPSIKVTVILGRLWKYLKKFKWMLLLAVALSIAGNLLALVGPKLSGHAVDAIHPGPGGVDFQSVFFYAGWMVVFYIVSAVLSYLLAALLVNLGSRVVYEMRRDVYEHLMRLPVRFFDSHAAGEILSVLSYDIDTVQASLSNDLVQMLASVITVLGSLWMMLTISPPLVLIFAVTIPCSILFTRYRSIKVRPLYRQRSINLGKLNGYTEEMTGGLRTIKAYHRQEYFAAGFEKKNAEACEANYQADSFSSATGPSVGFINNVSLALISLFGALLYMSGSISLGSVSSFVLYSRKFSGPINEFSNIISELQSALAAAERVLRLLDEPEEESDPADALPLTEVQGNVELRDVSFGYQPGVPVLQHYNLTAKPGQVVAIVGPTGAGKTTIINLLMRFYDVDSGVIFVDGCDIRRIRRGDLRRAFSMVLQDTWLFTGTIRENLTYGKENLSEGEVIAATKAAKIHDFIISLPAGYDTILKEGGSSISKGQKQLLTIARAMLLDAPMLILDEATSNVDTQTERVIQAAMLSLMKGRTSFVIAHRLSTIQNADVIAVLRNGCVAECGTHEELIQAGGYYAELYQAQFDTAEQYSDFE